MPNDIADVISHYLRPRAVAIVGASANPAKLGTRILQKLQTTGFAGAVYPVNPSRTLIDGVPSYSCLADIPHDVDHVIVTIDGDSVVQALSEAAAIGARFATVFSSGFAESGSDAGTRRQGDLDRLLSASDLRIMGPNCNGFVNFVDSVALTATRAATAPLAAAGNLGIVAQSGGLGQVATMFKAQQAGLGISYEISTGNSTDLDALDFVEFLVGDRRTHAISLIIESIRDGEKLVRVGELAQRAGKPMAALKLGRTAMGGRAAQSHTGALVSPGTVYQAAFTAAGIEQVFDTHELYDWLADAGGTSQSKPGGVAVLGVSGGSLVLFADLADDGGIDLPEFEAETVDRLRAVLPPFGVVSNPLDVTLAGQNDPNIMIDSLRAVMDDPGIATVVVLLTMATSIQIDVIRKLASDGAKDLVVLWTGGTAENWTPSDFVREGIVTFTETSSCIRGLKARAGIGKHSTRLAESAKRLDVDVDQLRHRLRDASGDGAALSEYEGKRLLAVAGLAAPDGDLAPDVAAAVQIADRIGYPVVAKLDVAGLTHKSDIGGVVVGLTHAEAVREATQHLLERGQPMAGQLNGVLIECMVASAVELFLGAEVDEVFGPIISVGFGGTRVEVDPDLVWRLSIPDRAAAIETLGELRGRALLRPWRGEPGVDMEAVSDALVTFSALVHALNDSVAGIEINPLFALRGGGVLVGDVVITRSNRISEDTHG